MATSPEQQAHPVNGEFAYDKDAFGLESPSETEGAEASIHTLPTAEYDPIVSAAPKFSVGRSWKVRALTGFIWLCVLVAAAGGVYAFFRAQPQPAPTLPPLPNTITPGGFAQMAVTAYLEADSANAPSLSQYYANAQASDFSDIQSPQLYVVASSVINVTAAGSNYDTVRIAVQVSNAKGLDPTIQYYEVPIAYSVVNGYNTYDAVSYPHRTNAVKLPDNPPTLLNDGAPDTTDAENTTIQAFLNSYYAGKGALNLTVTSGSFLHTDDNAPYKRATLVGANAAATATVAGKAGNEIYADVTFKTVDANNVSLIQNATLLMEYQNGNWLVKDVQSPPLATSGN